jgi:hypothetical protein
MKKTIFLLPFLILGFGTVDAAHAITFGVPDGGEHPYVGVTVFTKDWENYYTCSGTLIAPTVFLTAGHCAADAAIAWVSFDEDPDEDFTTWESTGIGMAHPDFNDFALPNTNDIGVILLDEPVEMETYGVLAPLGYLDRYKKQIGLQNTIFEQVGYGVNSYKPRYEWYAKRYKGEQRIINLVNKFTDGYNVMFTNNPGKGNGVGGTCSGDSGGPVFVNNTNIIVAVVSFGVAPWCKGNDYDYRVDIENSYEFLAEFVEGLR